MKNLGELKLSELIELKTASDFICEKFSKEMMSYAEVNQDPYFRNADAEMKNKYERVNKAHELSQKVSDEIEKRLEEYYG